MRSGGHLLAAFSAAGGEPLTRYDHTVTPAYRWPPGELAGRAARAGFAGMGRMSREPPRRGAVRRGHLLMRRR